MKRKLHIICNTHWDREHRHEYQETRMMLVELVDYLLDLFEKDEDFNTFIIDGQTVVLEDYLEVKPYNRARLENAIKKGRLQVGPWYTLPDHTSANPESLIRNLLIGDKIAKEFGHRMNIGYSIFSFGQIGQLPQIYRNFGIDKAIFYKGAPLTQIDKNEFIWKSPDGSSLLASKLGDWFRCNFFVYVTVPVIMGGDLNIPGQWKCDYTDGNKLISGADEQSSNQFMTELCEDIYIREDVIDQAVENVTYSVRNSNSDKIKVVFDGIDFSTPAKELTEVIRIANKKSNGKYEFVQSDLEKYFHDFCEDVDIAHLQVLEGEMRNGPIQGVHSETISSNTEIKQRLAEVENKLLYTVEPFAIFTQNCGFKYPSEFIGIAWKNIMKAEAHDSCHGAGDKSIKGNSLYIIDQSHKIADALSMRIFRNILKNIDMSGKEKDELFITVFNPAPYCFTGVVRLLVNIPSKYNSKQISFYNESGERLDSYTYDSEDKILGSINADNRPKAVFVRRYTADVYMKDIPSYGYVSIQVKYDKNEYDKSNPFGEPYFPYNPIVKQDGTLDNGKVKVSVNSDCTLDIIDYMTGHHIHRTHIIRDSGDKGNVWVHDTPSFNNTVIPYSTVKGVSILENSALKGEIEINYSVHLPIGLTEDKRRRLNTVNVVDMITRVTLKKDDSTIYFKTMFNNTVEDHKLSICFPTGIAAGYSYSDMAFEIKRRTIDYCSDSYGYTGNELLRHPMRRFIDISDKERGFCLLSKGIHEFETYNIHGKAAVELTLQRFVTQRFPIHDDVFVDFDENPAESIGSHTYEYAVCIHEGDYTNGLIRKAASYVIDPIAYQHAVCDRHGSLPLWSKSFFYKENDLVELSCIKLSESSESVIVRICNPTESFQKETLFFCDRNMEKAEIVRADESTLESELEISGNKVIINLAPYKVYTLRIRLK